MTRLSLAKYEKGKENIEGEMIEFLETDSSPMAALDMEYIVIWGDRNNIVVFDRSGKKIKEISCALSDTVAVGNGMVISAISGMKMVEQWEIKNGKKTGFLPCWRSLWMGKPLVCVTG